MALQKIDLAPGTGAEIKSGQTALVHYTGWLYDAAAPENKGKKFDSSVDRNEPFEFPVGAGMVIRGWDEGVVGMKVGGKRRLVIPPEMGYGARGAGGVIPPGRAHWCSTSSWWRFVDAARRGRCAGRARAVAGGAAQAATLIHAGRVIDGVSDSVKTNQTVVVDGRQDHRDRSRFSPAGGGRPRHRPAQGTLMPGLFDMHVHLTGEYSQHSEIDDYKLNEARRRHRWRWCTPTAPC